MSERSASFKIAIVYKASLGPKLASVVFGLFPLTLIAQVPASPESLERAKLIEEQEKMMNIAVFAILFFFMLGIILFVVSRRKSGRIREPQIFEAKPKRIKPVSAKNANPNAFANEPSGSFSTSTKTRAPLVITDDTQNLINSLVTSIKVPEAKKQAPPTSDELQKQVDDLESSEVMKALANTLVSAPVTDETPSGKFSKMSIEGDLIFGEEIEQKKIETHFQISKPPSS